MNTKDRHFIQDLKDRLLLARGSNCGGKSGKTAGGSAIELRGLFKDVVRLLASALLIHKLEYLLQRFLAEEAATGLDTLHAHPIPLSCRSPCIRAREHS